MSVLSNITQSNVSNFARGDCYRSMYDHNDHNNGSVGSPNSRNSATGFTLLQGHIQLMAMVPNLPENQTSPRWKNPTISQEHGEHTDTSLSITPRTMPSASKYQRPHLPKILASKASQRNTFPFSPSAWQQPPRSLSNLSLPPKHSQPITMPSFAKCLPGTKRAVGHHHETVVPGMNYATTAGSDLNAHLNSNTTCFPIIPTQPSYQVMGTVNKEGLQQQKGLDNFQLPPTTTAAGYVNPCSASSWVQQSPQPTYQMMNAFAANQQPQQQTIDYMSGSGDHIMTSVLRQYEEHQQQLSYEQATTLVHPYHNSFPYSQPAVVSNDAVQYLQQLQQQQHPPYAVQSLPCFGTPYTSPSSTNVYAHPNYGGSPQSRGMGHSYGGVGVVLPHIAESPQPVYSASMPEICLSTVHPQEVINRIDAPPLLLRKVKMSEKTLKRQKAAGNEVSIVVEDSSSSSSSSSSSEEDFTSVNEHSSVKEKLKGRCKSISIQKLREIQKEKAGKRAEEEAKYAALGPQSNPGKMPSKLRVTHTPVSVQVQILPGRETPGDHKDNINNRTEQTGETCNCVGVQAEEENPSVVAGCCPHCKCCQNESSNDSNNRQEKPSPSVEEKLRDMKSKLTPRKKGKQVVVAVHDCFPSDSSVSEEDSDNLDSARRKGFLNNYGCSGATMRRRKPRIDSILKLKLKGDSSEVFEDLDTDLNPDEARTYTCDYLAELLTSKDWNNCYTALQVIVRLARHRPKVLLCHLSGPILWCTFHHITSPKSALCRAAIVTFRELFQRIGSALDNDLEKITEKLVLKSLAPNMFIREECDRALEAMVGNCNLVKVLTAMDNVTSKPHARAGGHRLAKMALQVVQIAGVDTCLKPVFAEKLLPMLFCFMTEANNTTRTAAKEALGMLMNHLQFETAVTRHVTFDRNCTEVFKKLDKMRGRSKNRRPIGNARYPLPHAHFRR